MTSAVTRHRDPRALAAAYAICPVCCSRLALESHFVMLRLLLSFAAAAAWTHDMLARATHMSESLSL